MESETYGARIGRGLRLALVALLLMALIAGCVPRARQARLPATAVAGASSVGAVVAVTSPPSLQAALMLQLVNQERARVQRCGGAVFAPAPPLGWNDALALAAEGHARSMAQFGYLSHVSPSGGTVGARIAATGYPARTWGENIAAGYVDPAEAVAGFLASPAHCLVLMDAGFEALGAAFVEDEASVFGSYWTLVFAAPQPLAP